MIHLYEINVWDAGTTTLSNGKEGKLFHAEITGHCFGLGTSPALAMEMLATQLRAKEKNDAEEGRS